MAPTPDQMAMSLVSVSLLLPIVCLLRPGSAARSSEDGFALDSEGVVSLARDGEKWRVCNPFSSETTRRYYFQSVEEDGDPTAIEFVRDTRSPALIFHKHGEWTARYEKHYESTGHAQGLPSIWKTYRSTWLPASPAGSERPVEKSTLLLGPMFVQYIRCVPVPAPDGASPCILEVKGQGKKSELFGGMYFPDSLARQALRHFKNGKAGPELLAPNPDCTSGSVSILGSEETTCQLRVAATVEAALQDSSFDSSDWKFKDARNTNIGAAMAGGFIVGGAGGGPIGAVVGGALSTAAVGAGSLYKYFARKSDVDLSASEKIFEKLRCMSIFKTCDGDVLVPKGRPCPQL